MSHLIGALDDAGYFFPPDKRLVMERNLRVALARAGFTETEIRALRGVIKALARKGSGGGE
jgi:tRNA/rRNA methyltransferase